ncbi:MAG TPA: glycosyltransferase family 4 protein [archaeon]|nr:glycosyltransferase family 4 protein [archaeon]HPV65857.1 glycosyltransferase family 4 protein [archaeon]
MKIVHVCDYIQPQLGYQEYYLAKEHAKMGHEVTVITSDRYYPFPNYENTAEKILGDRKIGVGITNIDGFKIIRLKSKLEFGTKNWLIGLEKEISKISPDLLICHGMDTFNAYRVAKLKKKFSFKLIYDDHPYTPFKKISAIKSIYYYFFNFKLIERMADKLIIKSQDGLKHVNLYYKFKKPVIVGALGVDSNLFKFNKLLRRKIRQKYSISPKEVVLIYTGKITENKGVHLILKAISKSRIDNVVLIILGDGDPVYRQKLEKLSRKQKVIFIGAVKNNEMYKYFSAADIAIYPCESTISLFEAMSCSLPIICNVADSEIIKYNNGFAINARVKEISKKIQFLVKNAKLRKKMGKNSRIYVEKELSWRKIAEKFL